MPSLPISSGRQEEIRRQVWEDREYAAEMQAKARAHELEVLDRTNDSAQAQLKIKTSAVTDVKIIESDNKVKASRSDERLRRAAVLCITLLQLCGRPVPSALTDLLHR